MAARAEHDSHHDAGHGADAGGHPRPGCSPSARPRLWCLVAAASSAVPAGVAVALLLGLAWSSMHSTLQTWATQVFPAQRAATVSLFAGSLFAGSALGTLLLGGLAEDGRFGAAFLALAVVTVPLGVIGAVARARWESI